MRTSPLLVLCLCLILSGCVAEKLTREQTAHINDITILTDSAIIIDTPGNLQVIDLQLNEAVAKTMDDLVTRELTKKGYTVKGEYLSIAATRSRNDHLIIDIMEAREKDVSNLSAKTPPFIISPDKRSAGYEQRLSNILDSTFTSGSAPDLTALGLNVDAVLVVMAEGFIPAGDRKKANQYVDIALKEIQADGDTLAGLNWENGNITMEDADGTAAPDYRAWFALVDPESGKVFWHSASGKGLSSMEHIMIKTRTIIRDSVPSK